MHKYAKNMQWPQKYVSCAFICKKYGKYARHVSMKVISKICKNMHPPLQVCWMPCSTQAHWWQWLHHQYRVEVHCSFITTTVREESQVKGATSRVWIGDQLLPVLCHCQYLCQWAPAVCLGFLLVTFGTVWALTSFEFPRRACPLTIPDGQKIRNPRTPSTMQACSFFSNPFLEFCFSTPAFSSTILLHKFMQVFDTLKIPVHCFGTLDTLKKVICQNFAWSFGTHFFFSSLSCHFIWIWIIQSYFRASSLSSRVQIQPLSSLMIICFRNSSQHAHAPPLKTPLATSPACFNHSIIFESLLLQLSSANPPYIWDESIQQPAKRGE